MRYIYIYIYIYMQKKDPKFISNLYTNSLVGFFCSFIVTLLAQIWLNLLGLINYIQVSYQLWVEWVFDLFEVFNPRLQFEQAIKN